MPKPSVEPQSASNRKCACCGRPLGDEAGLNPDALRPAVVAWLATEHASWRGHGPLCEACSLEGRTGLLIARLQSERGELSAIEADIAIQASKHNSIATHIDEEFARTATFGDRVADQVAAVGGSWTFVISMILVLLVWIAINVLMATHAWDPYPFILLNLGLSSIAALQAPVIMMSQNRASARDRAAANGDFRVNLKSEIEIALLHEKVDHMLHAQWERQVELHEVQIELLTELRARVEALAVRQEAASVKRDEAAIQREHDPHP